MTRSPQIAVVDYGMGNLRSVQKALERVGAQATVTDSPAVLRKAQGVVLPGVGAFGEAVKRLKTQRLWDVLQETLASPKPFLGICLGLQLLFESSEESPKQKGLGFLKGSVVRFPLKGPKSLKVPHMGWNQLKRSSNRESVCLSRVRANDFFYFVHSYYPEPEDKSCIAATTSYGRPFCSAVARGNLFASQFHPEKSGAQGLKILKSFVEQVARCS